MAFTGRSPEDANIAGSNCEFNPSRNNRNASARICEIRDSVTPRSSANSRIGRSSKKHPRTTVANRSGNASIASRRYA
ncbi:hypothetical protein GCM10025883_02780 [Mobilicoccus caccae]|uniref:Uncharacterized protein n=1 Tax=Mobilicoccus caccae TaxID=1859295 RepID=A0ABQ6IM01_9MICO|nr:hypothetical protein GCM10025883_02780 [Mobilicoccus caccae]